MDELINFSSHSQLLWKARVCPRDLADEGFLKAFSSPGRVFHSSRGIPARLTVSGGDFAPLDGRKKFVCDSPFLFSSPANLEAGAHGEEVIKNLSGIWWPFFFIGVLYFPRFATISRSDFDIAESPSPSLSFPRFHFTLRESLFYSTRDR